MAQSLGSNVRNSYEVKDYPYPTCLHSGTLNVLQVTDDDRMVLDTLIIMLECRNVTHRSGIKYQEKYEVNNYQFPPYLQSASLNILQVTDDDRMVLDTPVIMLEI